MWQMDEVRCVSTAREEAEIQVVTGGNMAEWLRDDTPTAVESSPSQSLTIQGMQARSGCVGRQWWALRLAAAGVDMGWSLPVAELLVVELCQYAGCENREDPSSLCSRPCPALLEMNSSSLWH